MATVDKAAASRLRKRHEIWQRPVVAESLADAYGRWRAHALQHGSASAFAALGPLTMPRRRTSYEEEVARFAAAAAALKLATEFREGAGEAPRYFRVATRVLYRAGIRTHGSRLSGLHDELRNDLAAAYKNAGREANGAWRTELEGLAADAMSTTLLVLADRNLEELGAADALLRLLEAELDDPSRSELAALRLARARTLRLAGSFEEAEVLLAAAAGGPEGHALRHASECAELSAMRSGLLDAPFRLLREQPTLREPERLLLMWFWAHAVESKAWRRELPKASSLARMLRQNAKLRAATRAAETLERAHRADLPIEARIHAVGQMLDEVETIDDTSMQLLAVAAAARWLLRAKQRDLAAVLTARYETLCASLSEGRSADLFCLRLPPAPEDVDAARSFDRSRPPATDLSRDVAFGRMALSLFKTGASSWAFASADERVTEYAETLAYHFSLMKGPAMKLGQLLSYYGFELPAEARSVLESLQDMAAPIDFPAVRRIVEADLGRPIEEIFRTFDENALAAGSIGQVHGAELQGGERVVVKVQYPGMRECIRRDFRALKLLVPLLRALLPEWDLEGIVAELCTRMLEECDYRIEGATQAEFRATYAGDPRVFIPAVFSKYTRERVLVSERFDGRRFAEFAASATQAERDDAAATVARFVVRSTVREGLFNTDMHPGNLMFADGKVAFLDFGNARRWPDGAGACWGVILRALMFEDREALGRGLIMAGLIDPDRPIDLAGLHEAIAGHLMRSVIEDRAQRIDKELLLAEIRSFGPDTHSEARRMRIPPIHVYGFRIYWGLFAVVADLGAEINFRRTVLAVLEE